MKQDPVIKGLVGNTEAPFGIYVETDSGITRRWLFGTKHPREFIGALEAAIARTRQRAAEQKALELSSVVPRDEPPHAS